MWSNLRATAAMPEPSRFSDDQVTAKAPDGAAATKGLNCEPVVNVLTGISAVSGFPAAS